MRVASKVQKAQEKQKGQKDETEINEEEQKEQKDEIDEIGTKEDERTLPLSEENLSIVFDEEMMNVIEAITYRRKSIGERLFGHFSSV